MARTETGAGLPRLPHARAAALDLPPGLRAVAASGPVTRVVTAVGDEAWLVTGYDEVRALFADPRLGRSHPDPERAARISDTAAMGGPSGDHATERSEHHRLRTLLVPAFTARRMERLRDRLQAAVDRLLDALGDTPQPADLHAALSAPLPVLATCALFDVPPADEPACLAWSAAISGRFDSAAEAGCGSPAATALDELGCYVERLVLDRDRSAPGLVTELLAAPLHPDEIVGLAALLFGGHDITSARLDAGALLLMTFLAERALLDADPRLWPDAVEEILRMSAPVEHGFPRYASADIDIGGVTVRAGEAVLLAGPAANRDPRAFPEPDRFDVRRRPNPHLALGHGSGFCLGAALARMEMEIALRSLFDRYPGLQPAVAPDGIALRATHLMGGMVALPVRW
jgi:cytochrome P450